MLLGFGCLISRGLRNSDANKSKAKAEKNFPQKFRNPEKRKQGKQMHSKKKMFSYSKT